MSDNYYGKNLDPERTNRKRGGLDAERHYISITNNPSTASENEAIEMRFPNLGGNDVITPGSASLTFNLTVTNGVPVNNIKANIIKRIDVRVEGNNVLTIEDSDVLYSYMDQWRTVDVKALGSYEYGDYGHEGGMTEACFKRRFDDTATATDDKKALAKRFKKRFRIPLNFELLETVMPFHQASMGERLSYTLQFNDANRFITSTTNNGTYKVSEIMLEYEKVRSKALASTVQTYYEVDTSIMFDRILRHRIIPVKSKDTVWNWNFASPVSSLRGILLIGKRDSDLKEFNCDSDKFWDFTIAKVDATVEGIPNQLYAKGMLPTQEYSEMRRLFAGAYKKSRAVDDMVKNLALADVTPTKFFKDKYALWLDFRSTQDNYLLGSGRKTKNVSEGVTVSITREASDGDEFGAKIYYYIFMDGVMHIKSAGFGGVEY